MDAGVTIYFPETVFIDPDVTAGPDTVLEPGVQLLGRTRIGARCTIRAGSILKDMRLDDDAVVNANCIMESSRIGSGAIVGPFSAAASRCRHSRPSAHWQFLRPK